MTDKPSAEENPAVKALRAWDSRAVAQVSQFRGEVTIVVPQEHLVRAAEYLQAEPDLQFTFLSDISAVDRFPLEPRFELNYHLL